MTKAQEKSHMDPTDLSSRTPFGHLMWRVVTYTHQVGADGSTIPLPSRKKILVIFGPLLLCCSKWLYIFCEVVYSQWEYQLKITSSICVQIETFYGNDIVNSRT